MKIFINFSYYIFINFKLLFFNFFINFIAYNFLKTFKQLFNIFWGLLFSLVIN
jgi:hypothetical protein